MLEKSVARINLELIRAIELSTNDISASSGRHRVIKDPKGNYYYLNSNQRLGEGGFGIVYKALKIDSETGQIDTTARPLAVKISRRGPTPRELKSLKNEVSIQKKYFPNTFLMHDKKNAFVFTELIEAKDLFDFDFQHQGDLQSFSLMQQLDLIEQIMMGVNLIHHNTISTGRSTIHKDLKPDNIMVSVGPRGQVNGYVIDFGIAHLLSEDDATKQVYTHAHGTPGYSAPEIYEHKGGVKSDIYSLAQVFKRILNVSSETSGVPSSAADAFVRNAFSKFLDRMESDYEQRPSSDEGLRFVVEMKNYLKLNQLLEESKSSKSESASIEADINICKAKIEILIHGVWDEKIGKRKIERWMNREIDPSELATRVPTEEILKDDYVTQIRETGKRPSGKSYVEVDKTIGDAIQANPAMGVVFNIMLQRNNWILSDEIKSQMEEIATYCEDHPDKGNVVSNLSSQWHPKMLSIITGIENTAANELLIEVADRGQLTRAALLAINYAKDKPELLDNLKSIYSQPNGEKTNVVIDSVVAVAAVSKELADKKGTLELERLVELTGKLFDQRGNIPKSVLLPVFKEIITQYKDSKEALQKPQEYEGIRGRFLGAGFGSFSAYTNQEKMNAAKELIALSQNPSKTIDLEGALGQGRLGEMAKMIDEVAHQPEARRP